MVKKYLVLIILLYLALVSRYFSYVPMWDAWDNAGRWIYQAVTLPFNPYNFDHGGHPSMVYFFILGLGQYLDLGNQYLIHATNAVLTVFSILAFWGIVNHLYPEIKNKHESYLLTFLYAFFPIITGSALHVNPDYGVLIFFVIYLYFLLKDRLLAAVITSIPMIFAKEPGIALYGFTICLYLGMQLFLERKSGRHIWKFIRRKIILLLPLLLFLLYFSVKVFVLKLSAWWIGAASFTESNKLTYWPQWHTDKITLAYLLGIFVINFNWVLTFFILLGFLNLFFKRSKFKPKLFFLSGLFCGTFLVVTFFETFANLRYFLPLYPLMILLFYNGLASAVVNHAVRRALLVAVVVIFFLAEFFTLDPISKRIYGTFKFGKHEMLKMTAITNECCGYGRDQLVYNTQYLNIAFLLDKIMADIKPDEQTAFAYQPLVGPAVFPKISKSTGARTLRNFSAFDPRIVNWNFESLAEKPEKLYYIEFPNVKMGDDYQRYLDYYQLAGTKNYEHLGYAMKVYLLELKV